MSGYICKFYRALCRVPPYRQNEELSLHDCGKQVQGFLQEKGPDSCGGVARAGNGGKSRGAGGRAADGIRSARRAAGGSRAAVFSESEVHGYRIDIRNQPFPG